MESKPKFSLENSIIQWRLMLTNDQKLVGDAVDELESHLLEEIEALKTSGLDDEEAFMVATKRMGHADLIAAEFRKVRGDAFVLDQITPYLTGVLILLAFVELTRLLNDGLFLVTYKMGLAVYGKTMLLLGALLLIVCVVGIFGLLLFRFKNRRLINIVTDIPTLISLVVGGRVLYYVLLDYLFLNNGIPMEHFALKSMNLNLFYMMLLIAFLIVSIVVFLRIKKRRHMTLTN